jgi:hypothetical protein
MTDWLTQLSEREPTAEDALESSVSSLSKNDLKELSYSTGVAERPTLASDMSNKIARAEKLGKELAREQYIDEEIDKFANLLGMAGKALGPVTTAMGAAGNTSSNMAKINTPLPGAGGVKQANLASSAAKAIKPSIGQHIAGFAVRNPAAASTAIGAGAGYALAPTDSQTGQKHHLTGMAAGGALGLMGGLAGGNTLRRAVVGKKEILGKGVAQYARDATNATKGTWPHAASASAQADKAKRVADMKARVGSTQAPPPYTGGPTMNSGGSVPYSGEHSAGDPPWAFGANPFRKAAFAFLSPMGKIKAAAISSTKVANVQSLKYDPASKSFARHHLTTDTSLGVGAGDVIPTGAVEQVKKNVSSVPRSGPNPSAVRPSGVPGETFQYGNAVTSARRIPARSSMPPIPREAMGRPLDQSLETGKALASIRSGNPIGRMGEAAKASLARPASKFPSMGGFASLAKAVK